MKIVAQHFTVPADLKPYLDACWYIQSDGPVTEVSSMQYCLATGQVEIIIHITPPFYHTGIMDGKEALFPEAFIGGIHVEPVMFQLQGGTGLFGISCKPETLIMLFNKPIGDLADNFAELDSYIGGTITEMVKQIQDAPSHEHRIQIAVNYFRKRVAEQKQRDRYYFSEAMQYIRMATGLQSVDEVCEKVFVGKRQLQRTFQENIGISPKTYVRIVRFKGAYDFVQHNPNTTWTEISHHFGYSDQSHFIRDFREFTGENPTAFISGFSPLYSTPLAITN